MIFWFAGGEDIFSNGSLRFFILFAVLGFVLFSPPVLWLYLWSNFHPWKYLDSLHVFLLLVALMQMELHTPHPTASHGPGWLWGRSCDF